MLHKPRILIIDENEGVVDLFDEIINTDNEYELFFENKKISTQDALLKENFDFILLCADSDICLDIGRALLKEKNCPPFALMGRVFENKDKAKDVVKAFKPIDTVKLPIELDDICEKIEYISFKAEGMIDEMTELYKKPCFEYKLGKLMKKKTDGIYFCISLNAYSFAANPSTPLQIQMAVFALKNSFSDAMLGINGNIAMGFLPTSMTKKDFEKRLNDTIKQMLEAAEGPAIYIPAGACTSRDRDYSTEDVIIYADKAMEYSSNEGKNQVKFYM